MENISFRYNTSKWEVCLRGYFSLYSNPYTINEIRKKIVEYFWENMLARHYLLSKINNIYFWRRSNFLSFIWKSISSILLCRSFSFLGALSPFFSFLLLISCYKVSWDSSFLLLSLFVLLPFTLKQRMR